MAKGWVNVVNSLHYDFSGKSMLVNKFSLTIEDDKCKELYRVDESFENYGDLCVWCGEQMVTIIYIYIYIVNVY